MSYYAKELRCKAAKYRQSAARAKKQGDLLFFRFDECRAEELEQKAEYWDKVIAGEPEIEKGGRARVLVAALIVTVLALAFVTAFNL